MEENQYQELEVNVTGAKKEADEALLKKIAEKLLDIDPKYLEWEAATVADYLPGEWMRQRFQIYNVLNDRRYVLNMLISLDEVTEIPEEQLENPSIAEVWAMLGEGNGKSVKLG